MPKGQAVPPETRRKIYTRYVMGESAEDIASSLGLSAGGVRAIIRKERKAVEAGMAAREKIVAGDKRNGRLTSTTDPHRFEDTCVIGGRKESKMFTAVNARNATDQWEKWCQDLRDEAEFMARAERLDRTPEPESSDADYLAEWAVPEAAKVLRAYESHELLRGSDRDLDVALAEDEKMEQIAELWAKVQELEAELAERKQPVAGVAAAPAAGHPAYALIAVHPEVKGYGIYSDMDAAFADLERLNDVAKMLGVEGAFEIHELEWRH